MIIEIRDDVGYERFDRIELEELERTGDIRSIIQHGINQARRAFDSTVLMELFTHESSFLRYLRPSDWDQIVAGVTSGTAS